MHYLCIVFFMVLDLRLTMKIVVVVRQPFLFYRGSLFYGAFSTPIYFFLKNLLKNKS
jgi:hypothetical protein